MNDMDISEARTVSTVRTSLNGTVEIQKNKRSVNRKMRESENSKNKNNSVPWMKRRNGGVLQV